MLQAAWFTVQNLFFSKWWLPAALRPLILRLFGADIGYGVFIRHGVRVLWPWKLTVGDNCWIGEDAWILNLEPVRIGHDVCVSQGVFLCTGSHDMASPTFEYDNGPITVGDETWLGAQALILRGVTIGRGAVIAARSRVSSDVIPESVLRSTR
jgi:putative colanic acid biosynthesis acetyltransferase WcaF